MTIVGRVEAAGRGDLTLRNILDAAGIDAADVLVIRHTYRQDGLRNPYEATPDAVREYTRDQGMSSGKFPKAPPRLWLIFMADGRRRSRFLTAYENRGEVVAEVENRRFFDLHQSEALSSLRDRLVIEWSADTINWAKSGGIASRLPVVEIADPSTVPFPGFDRVGVVIARIAPNGSRERLPGAPGRELPHGTFPDPADPVPPASD